MNVFQNILYLYLSSPTRCSVSDTDRPQVYLVNREAPNGIARQLTRIGEMGILWRGGVLNSSTDAVTQELPVRVSFPPSTEGSYR